MSLKTLAIITLLLLTLACPAKAQELDIVLGPPPGRPATGAAIVLPVYFHNPENSGVEVSLPAELTCRLSSAALSLEVVAARVDPTAGTLVVSAGSYIKALYALDLPILLAGDVRLDVPELGDSGVAFTVDATPPSLAKAAPAPATELQDAKIDMDSFIQIYQPYARNIFFYQPMYFLAGIEPEETKFQLSFKYRFFNPEKGISQKHPWVPNIFMGYTQTSFWDLASDSRAFEDTSYKPEIFYQTPNIDTGVGLIKGLFLQTGFQHESNGRGGDESRSTNYLYLEPSLIFLEEKEVLGLRIAPRFWLYVNNSDDTNPDIEHYRGFFDLGLTFGKANRFIFDNHFRWAKEGASIEVNLTYPLHHLLRDNIDLYLHVQYANVLGESLLHYSERTEAVRIGLAIVR